MTEWKVAMLIVAFILSTPQQWRAWAVVFGASMAAFIYQGPMFYAAIDLGCCAALLRLAAVPKVGGPGAGWPKAIAGLFFAMFCLDISALIYGPPVHYALAMVVLGWGQWALLLAWGFPLSLFRKRLGENPAPEPWSIFDLRNKAVS